MEETNNIVDEEVKDKDIEKQEEKKDEKGKTFTQDELEKIVQSRLARAEKDKAKAIEEAEKLAKMNEAEKQKYEFEKLQRENEELKAAQNRYSLGREATKMLSDSGIIADDDVLSFVVREDAESTKEAVSTFSALIDRISDERMREKLKGNSPKVQTIQTSTMSKDEIMKIKDTQKRQKLIQENIHLFQ